MKVIIYFLLVGCALGQDSTTPEPTTDYTGPTTTRATPAPWPCTRVFMGETAKRGDFPYMVSIQSYGEDDYSHYCGGTILTPNWIVTAGHCAPDYLILRVVVGILMQNDTNVERQERNISQKIIHPLYNNNFEDPGFGPNDIALLELQSPIDFNNQVQPIVLPTTDFNTTGPANLTGWGTSTNDDEVLQLGNFTILPNDVCQDTLDDILLNIDNPYDEDCNVCTDDGPTQMLSACRGDDGGPLVQNGVLVGIVSWYLTYNNGPTVYTRVNNYVEWITQYVTDL